MFNNRLPINKAGAVTPEKAKSRCTPGKDDATARLKLGSIVKRTALTVTWLACCFAGAAAMASCADGALDCNPKPLPKECEHAL